MSTSTVQFWLAFHAQYQTLINIVPNIQERMKKLLPWRSENASIDPDLPSHLYKKTYESFKLGTLFFLCLP